MFRWYSPIIRELKKDHRIVLVSKPDDVDETSISLFDRFVPVSNGVESLQEVLDSCCPDIVYYPSIGMRAWVIALANVRWAPLQIMSAGHPATTHIDSIDGVILGANLISKPSVFSENKLILEAKAGTLADYHRNLDMDVLSRAPCLDETRSLRVAVPCISLKINSEFIRALKEIKTKSPVDIEYTFFPNESGLTHSAIKRRLVLAFPDASVEKRGSYMQYMKNLSSHDIALSPFPFGNASSLADCLILGIPAVVLDGDEPHSGSDRVVYHAANIDTNLICKSIDEYIDKALSLISSSILRAEEREKIKSSAVHDLHKISDKPFAAEFCDALRWAEKNADLLRDTRGRTYYPKDSWHKKCT